MCEIGSGRRCFTYSDLRKLQSSVLTSNLILRRRNCDKAASGIEIGAVMVQMWERVTNEGTSFIMAK